MKKLSLINLSSNALSHIKGGDSSGGGSTPVCSCSCDCDSGGGDTIPNMVRSNINSTSISATRNAPNPT